MLAVFFALTYRSSPLNQQVLGILFIPAQLECVCSTEQMNQISRRADQSLALGLRHKADSGMAEECCVICVPDRRGRGAASHQGVVTLYALREWWGETSCLGNAPGIPAFHLPFCLSQAHGAHLVMLHVNVDVQIL